MNETELLERALVGRAVGGPATQGRSIPADQVTDQVSRLVQLARMVEEQRPHPVIMRAEARNDLRNSLLRQANIRAADPPPRPRALRSRQRPRPDT